MRQCREWLNDSLPDKNVPSSCQISYPGETCVNGEDWVKMFETFDIVMEHYSQQFEPEPLTHRYLENLREAYGTSTGIGEWYVSGPGDIFDEAAIRNNGLRQFYQNIQWGRSTLVFWLGHDFSFLHNGNWTENRLGHTVLRYHSAYIPLGIARAQAHRAIYLETPLVKPEVGILESESSFYNVWNVRGGGSEFSSLLFRKGHDYGNLFERLLVEGRQSLDGYKVVILPEAVCLPDGFAEKLSGWVKEGGVLITTGPAGLNNEYGVKSGKFLDEVIGPGQWNYENGILKVTESAPGINVKAYDTSNRPALLEKSYGKGKVYLRTSVVPENLMYELISGYAPRKFYGKDNRFQLAMRQGKDGIRYLSLLNPDCYETLEDEIVLEGEYKKVADISNNFPLLPEIQKGKTSFKVRLTPAEGVMIRIEK